MFCFRQIVRGRNPGSGFFSGEVCRLGASARSPAIIGMIAGTDVPGHVLLSRWQVSGDVAALRLLGIPNVLAVDGMGESSDRVEARADRVED